MISDADGIILDIIGDNDIIEEGKSSSRLIVGANRGEAFAGTNAIGTSLITGKAIQIWSEEHYLLPHKKYTCSGAPVKNSEGTIIGCLNITGLESRIHVHTLGMVLAMADSISKDLFIRKEKTVPSPARRPAGKPSEFPALYTFDDITGKSPAITATVALSKRAAMSSSNVLLLGESGTGKELFAHAIHNGSNYAQGPFVVLNCGALPAGLVESELFGYEGGAFTGANKSGQQGTFELADGGTIFLDEIGEMPLDLQSALLRVIQTREIVRVGGKYPKRIDVRIIAATNKDLWQAVQERKFREDLYFRLNVFTIALPALRERQEDVVVLADHFIRNKCGAKTVTLSPEVCAMFQGYSWPGNIRELENTIERAINIADGAVIRPEHLPKPLIQAMEESHPRRKDEQTEERLNLQDIDYKAILLSLDKTSGNIRKAAALLGINRRTLYRKMERFGIPYRDYRRD
ncbi:MAG: sigma 54-interacting transcriptional regulator [Spirochaetaceae bacterium]|nr:sigma 54-interacting transcriptional regulator [Spirochaetaceae bacterium]